MGNWELVFVTCYSVFSLYTLNSNLSREVGTGHIGKRGYLFYSVMDISERELRKILRRHEKISEANRSALHQRSTQVRDLEQSFSQRIERLETECFLLRSLIFPQPIQSISINQGFAAS